MRASAKVVYVSMDILSTRRWCQIWRAGDLDLDFDCLRERGFFTFNVGLSFCVEVALKEVSPWAFFFTLF